MKPWEILHEMTEELLALLFEKRNERVRAMNQTSDETPRGVKPIQRISDQEMFASMGVTVGRV